MWNYRVVKQLAPEIEGLDPALTSMYGVREIYYADNTDLAPNGYTTNEISAHGSTRSELREDLDRWLRAFSKPVLIVSDEGQFVGEEAPLAPLGVTLP